MRNGSKNSVNHVHHKICSISTTSLVITHVCRPRSLRSWYDQAGQTYIVGILNLNAGYTDLARRVWTLDFMFWASSRGLIPHEFICKFPREPPRRKYPGVWTGTFPRFLLSLCNYYPWSRSSMSSDGAHPSSRFVPTGINMRWTRAQGIMGKEAPLCRHLKREQPADARWVTCCSEWHAGSSRRG